MFSFLTDFICAAFPIVLLRNLNIRKTAKIAPYCLMGIGIITGAVAIARTATAYQVKSEDLLWVGISNAMTRIFEVNIGNSAACLPILRSFIRYAHAKATGKHPKSILRRKSIAPQPSRWCTREFWSRRRSSPVYDKEANSHPLPAGVAMAPRAVQDVDTSNGTERTLGLPLQGIRVGHQSDDSMPGLHDWRAKREEDERKLRRKESERSLHPDFGLPLDVRKSSESLGTSSISQSERR